MTGNKAKIPTGGEKSLIEVRQESGNMFDSQRIGVFVGLFHVRGVEMEPNVAV